MQNNRRENLSNSQLYGILFGMMLGASVGLVYALVLNVQPVLGVSVAAGVGIVASIMINMVNPDVAEEE